MASQWRGTFSRDGAYFAYSTGGSRISEKEVLFAAKTEDAGDPAKHVKIGEDISRWQISLNSKRVYYYKQYNYNTEGEPAGTLTMADFPSGANDTTLGGRVGAYVLLNDGTANDTGLAIFQNVSAGKGTLKIMGDPSQPQSLVTVASNIACLLYTSDAADE